MKKPNHFKIFEITQITACQNIRIPPLNLTDSRKIEKDSNKDKLSLLIAKDQPTHLKILYHENKTISQVTNKGDLYFIAPYKDHNTFIHHLREPNT